MAMMLWKQLRILFLVMVLGGVLFVLLKVILAITADNDKVKDSSFLPDTVDLTLLSYQTRGDVMATWHK